MEAINAEIAHAAVSGRLEKNPVMQGMLLQCLNRLEREERGVMHGRGRQKVSSDMEKALLADSALSLAILGGNKNLCQELAQNLWKSVRVDMDELHSMGLPCPSLALMHPEVFEKNLTLVDQIYPRGEHTKARRLMLAVDGTYLIKSLCQFWVGSELGLVGGPWSPSQPDHAFVGISKSKADIPKAPIMLELLCWDPCAIKNSTFSIGAMPMSLAAPKSDEAETQVHAGNWES
eukprot:s1370_g21.t1